LKASWC